MTMRDEQACALLLVGTMVPVPLGLRASSYLVWAMHVSPHIELQCRSLKRAVFPGFIVMVRTSCSEATPRFRASVDRSLKNHGTAVAATGG